jgi:thiol-disulfide isomerase/thioredoxin
LDIPADAEPLRRRLSLGLTGAAATLLAILAMFGISAGVAASLAAPAPDFDLALLDGGRVTDADLLGRVTVINIWASWCPPCREEAPILRRVYEAVDPQRVAFLGVIRNDREENARAFAADQGLTYPNAVGDDEFASAFGVRGIPMTYVLDTDGRIVARHFGPISEPRLTALIDDALARSEAAESAGQNESSP